MIDDADAKPLAAALLIAPAWQRLGIAVSDPRMRERAALALASSIIERVKMPGAAADPNQLSLPL